MKAVFQHEVASYFTGLTGYVFGAFLLLFTGVYTMAYCLAGGLANFEYIFNGLPLIFLIIVPILTMRVIAEERRQRTDQLLYSLPLSMTQVVLGKYFALLVLFAIPVAVLCLYPLILSAFGTVYLPAAYGAVVGFFFLGASLISIGLFLSSLTESQGVAAGLCFVIMLLNYFLTSLASLVSTTATGSLYAITIVIVLLALLIWRMTKNGTIAVVVGAILEGALLGSYFWDSSMFEGLFASIMQELSLFQRFYTFVDGVFDLTAIVYFITVIGFFLFLSVQSMEKRRWSE